MYSDYCQWWFGQCQGADTYLKKPKMAFSLLKLLVHCPDITCAVGLTTGNFGELWSRFALESYWIYHCIVTVLSMLSSRCRIWGIRTAWCPGCQPWKTSTTPTKLSQAGKNMKHTTNTAAFFLFLWNMFHRRVPAWRLDQVETYLKQGCKTKICSYISYI